MGFLQNYPGLEPVYKDGNDLPLLGMQGPYRISTERDCG